VASGVPIRLPKVSQKVSEGQDQSIILVIDRRGHIYFKGEKVETKDLEGKLQSHIEKEGPVNLVLEADKQVRHGRVVHVMDLAKRAGVSSIIIAAQWEPKEEY